MASLFLLRCDPLDMGEFGAEEHELESIYRYRKSLRELQTQHGRAHQDEAEPVDPDALGGPKGRGKMGKADAKRKGGPDAKGDGKGGDE